jgi:hypothetical protein
MELHTRLRTRAEVIPWMQVRRFDGKGLDVTAISGPGQPASKGPVTSLSYFGDDHANTAHSAVALASPVPIPDSIFGDKVARYIILKPGRQLPLDELRKHLKNGGASVETWPEHLFFVHSLSSRADVAKEILRQNTEQHFVAKGVTGR